MLRDIGTEVPVYIIYVWLTPEKGDDIMNIQFLLICVITNVIFLLIGYFIGKDKHIIEVEKSGSTRIIALPKEKQYDDEPATFITPEQEIALEQAYQEALRKERDKYGI